MSGPVALIVRPDGSAALTPLPDHPARAAQAISDAIGGPLEAILGADWCAYVDEHYLDHGSPVNGPGDHLARLLGWRSHPGEILCGPVVFLGRRGHDETDVPDRVLRLAGILPPEAPS